MAQIQGIKGFADLFPQQSRVFTYLENTAREVFTRYAYGELRTPLLEYTELFCRSIGTETDVVQKEMYTFQGSKDKSYTLRPEATAGVMRAYIQENLAGKEAVSKLFTIGPMFRHERPQKGRMRQFHQINCECLGPQEPEADAELMVMLMDFLGHVGIRKVSLQINSLGCSQCRPVYRKILHEWLQKLDVESLCEDCRRRLETNPLRVLDCKVPTCKEQTLNAPRILDHNCPDCKQHFDTVLQLLQAQNQAYVINHRLVRGLDYYVRTTFEVVADNIGAQASIAGGGRYDGLVASLGGPETPGLGFACGMERLALVLAEQENLPPELPDFYMALLDESCRIQGFVLSQQLRNAGFRGSMAFGTRSAKATLRQADK